MDTQNTISKDTHYKKVEDMPPKLVFELKQYTAKLKQNHPNWKPEKLAKKVCEKFNIKMT